MSEWLKEHAWKACVLEKVPWVRIPLSPHMPCFAPQNRAFSLKQTAKPTLEGLKMSFLRKSPKNAKQASWHDAGYLFRVHSVIPRSPHIKIYSPTIS
jgi:hypothetical protein